MLAKAIFVYAGRKSEPEFTREIFQKIQPPRLGSAVPLRSANWLRGRGFALAESKPRCAPDVSAVCLRPIPAFPGWPAWTELNERGAFEFAISPEDPELQRQAVTIVGDVLSHSDPNFSHKPSSPCQTAPPRRRRSMSWPASGPKPMCAPPSPGHRRQPLRGQYHHF